MRITQDGDAVTATHISGPTHNLLGFLLNSADASNLGEPVFLYEEPTDSWPLEDVKKAVLQGIEFAGGSGPICIRAIRLLGTDTPRVDVYEWLAFRMTRHLNEQYLNEQHGDATLKRVAG